MGAPFEGIARKVNASVIVCACYSMLQGLGFCIRSAASQALWQVYRISVIIINLQDLYFLAHQCVLNISLVPRSLRDGRIRSAITMLG